MRNRYLLALGSILGVLLIGGTIYFLTIHGGFHRWWADDFGNDPAQITLGLLLMVFAVSGILGLYGLFALRQAKQLVHKYQISAEGTEIMNTLLEKQISELTAELTETVTQLNQEIEERRQLAEQLKLQATNDSLTGLLNRGTGMALLVNQLNMSERYRWPLTIWSINIDNLKQIRKRLGHEVGDQLIIEMSRIICENIRKSDTVFRMGDDEMIVILPQCTIAEAMVVRERIINSCRLDQKLARYEGQTDICDGFAEYRPGSRIRVTDLVQQAGQDAYKDKNHSQITSADI